MYGGVDVWGGYVKVIGNVYSSSIEYNYGVRTLGNGTILDVVGNVTVDGSSSYGAYARNLSEVNIAGNLSVFGNNARAIESHNDGTVNVTGDVRAEGEGTVAVLAYAGDTRVSTANVNGNVYAIGDGAYGAWTQSIGLINVTGNITVQGNDTIGAGAWGNNSTTNVSGDICVSGDDSAAVYAHVGTVNVSDGEINVSGSGSAALFINEDAAITLSNVTARASSNILLYSEGYGKVTAGNGTMLYGDVINNNDSFAGYELDITLYGASSLTGSVTNVGGYGGVSMTLSGMDDFWNVTGDSSLTSLSLNGSTISFAGQEPGTVLTTDELSGTGGMFRMATDMSSLTGDSLNIITSSAGSYTIGVTDYGNGAADQNDRFTLIEDADGTADFSLAGGYANLGLWHYGLESVASASGGASWQLYSLGTASDPASAAVNTFRGTWLMGYAETQTLIQRMGDLRRSPNLSGVWFRVHGGKFEADAGRFAGAFDMDYGGVQVGFDRKFDKWNGDLYLGAMFSYADGDLDFEGMRGDGTINSRTLGVYGTYARPDGFYLDAVLKYQWADNKFHTVEPLGGVISAPSASTGGFGMSLEAGKRFQIGEAKNGGGWYVEPQAQISYQYYDGGSFRTNNNLEISAGDFKSLTGGVGALVGYQTEKSNFYAKASIVKEFDGDMTIRSGASSFEESFGDDWFVYGIGFTSRVNGRNSLYLDVERTSGSDFSQPWRVSAGWRLEF